MMKNGFAQLLVLLLLLAVSTWARRSHITCHQCEGEEECADDRLWQEVRCPQPPRSVHNIVCYAAYSNNGTNLTALGCALGHCPVDAHMDYDDHEEEEEHESLACSLCTYDLCNHDRNDIDHVHDEHVETAQHMVAPSSGGGSMPNGDELHCMRCDSATCHNSNLWEEVRCMAQSKCYSFVDRDDDTQVVSLGCSRTDCVNIPGYSPSLKCALCSSSNLCNALHIHEENKLTCDQCSGSTCRYRSEWTREVCEGAVNAKCYKFIDQHDIPHQMGCVSTGECADVEHYEGGVNCRLCGYNLCAMDTSSGCKNEECYTARTLVPFREGDQHGQNAASRASISLLLIPILRVLTA